jgi:CHAD domain-containing protein
VKPESVDLQGAGDPREIVKRVVQTRLREAQRLATALEQRNKQHLHDFRIACKRLRYALERFASVEPSLESVAERLAMVQDALGEAHDRDVLLTILPPEMGETQRRLQRDREACIDRATGLWTKLRHTLVRIASHHL